MNLLNLATFLALLVVGLQYIINHFLDYYLEKHWIKRGIIPDLARIKVEDFNRKMCWMILFIYIAAIALGIIGLIRE
jgi:hypothetical protein